MPKVTRRAHAADAGDEYGGVLPHTDHEPSIRTAGRPYGRSFLNVSRAFLSAAGPARFGFSGRSPGWPPGLRGRGCRSIPRRSWTPTRLSDLSKWACPMTIPVPRTGQSFVG